MTPQEKLNRIEQYNIFKDDCYQLLEDGVLSVEEYTQQTNAEWEKVKEEIGD